MKASIQNGSILLVAESPEELSLLAANRRRVVAGAATALDFVDIEGVYLSESCNGAPESLIVSFDLPCAKCPHWEPHIDDELASVVAEKDKRGEIERKAHNCAKYLCNQRTCPFEKV